MSPERLTVFRWVISENMMKIVYPFPIFTTFHTVSLYEKLSTLKNHSFSLFKNSLEPLTFWERNWRTGGWVLKMKMIWWYIYFLSLSFLCYTFLMKDMKSLNYWWFYNFVKEKRNIQMKKFNKGSSTYKFLILNTKL